MKKLLFILLTLTSSYITNINSESITNKQDITQNIPIVIISGRIIDNEILKLQFPGLQLETRKYYYHLFDGHVFEYKAYLQITENNVENTIQNLENELKNLHLSSIRIDKRPEAIKMFENLPIQTFTSYKEFNTSKNFNKSAQIKVIEQTHEKFISFFELFNLWRIRGTL